MIQAGHRGSMTSWMNFVSKTRNRIRQIDVAPVTVDEELPPPHVLGPNCFCHPRRDTNEHGIPMFIHDHPVAGRKP